VTSLEVSLIGEEKLGLINGRRETTLRDIPQAGSKNRATFRIAKYVPVPGSFVFLPVPPFAQCELKVPFLLQSN
jgi:hypothetical protein